MLAVQRPRMGSRQPPDGSLPFPYSQAPPPQPPMAPHMAAAVAPDPAGAPLLSEIEAATITSFFENMTSGQFSTSFGEGLNFSDAWLGLPPQFMGSATSFGQQPPAQAQQRMIQVDSMPPYNLDFGFAMANTLMPPPPQPLPTPTLHLHQHQHLHHAVNSTPRPVVNQQPALHTRPLHTPPLHEAATEDVLAAATLLQEQARYGHGGANNGGPAAGMGPPTPTVLGHARHQPALDFSAEQRRALAAHAAGGGDDDHAKTFADMVFGSDNSSPTALNGAGGRAPALSRGAAAGRARGGPNSAASAKARGAELSPLDTMNWGSDASFNAPHLPFIPRSERETSEALERERLRYTDVLELAGSAENTRPSSPTTAAKFKTDHDDSLSPVTPTGLLHLRTAGPRQPLPVGGEARKPSGAAKQRRKTKSVPVKEESFFDDEEPLGDDSSSPPAPAPHAKTPAASRKRRSAVLDASSGSPDADGTPSALVTPATTSKRRRKSAHANGSEAASSASAAANLRTPRENLTEEQKRENHIKSEQKRRTHIRGGFEELCGLVPGIEGSGYSKSVMLGMVGDWLAELLKDVDALHEELEEAGKGR